MTKLSPANPLPQGWLQVNTVPGVRALVTNRHHPDGHSQGALADFNLGVHVGDDVDVVTRHRTYLSDAIGGHAIQWLDQVHGNRCLSITSCTTPAPSADAACTRQPDLALAVMSADCVPVLLWDSSALEVAVCHAGWQGLVQGVIAATVNSMRTDATHLHAWIGPCISPARYEVGSEVWERFDRLDVDSCLSPHTELHKRYLDLGGVAAVQLEQLGVTLQGRAARCTYDASDLFSHRAHQHGGGSGECGRFASVIWLDPADRLARD